MLTRVTIRNFKRFDEVVVELGNPVVFIGPNNSGKTTALQALALWDIGLRRWNEKRQGQAPEKRPGVTINRRDLIALPVPSANLLWRDLHVRDTRLSQERGKRETQNVRIEVVVEGVTNSTRWECGLEFDRQRLPLVSRHQGFRRFPRPTLRELLPQPRPAQPDAEDRLPYAGSIRPARVDRSGSHRSSRPHRRGL